MLAARVLSERFEQVIIVERDQLPQDAHERAGTPQDKHVHNLLSRGLQVMERLLPGFERDLEAHGALYLNWGKHARVLIANDHWMPEIDTPVYSWTASRALVEWVMRKHVLTRPNIQILERTQARNLELDTTQTRVVGVRVVKNGTPHLSHVLPADFVVDATGRSSKIMQWLNELGFDTPPETIVDAKVGYATRYFRKPANARNTWRVLYMPARAPITRGAGIFEVENNLWIASLGGFAGDYPPNTPDDWMEYARSLPKPDFYEAIKDAEPLNNQVIGYRRTRNYRRHFEKLPRFPERLVVVGDAVCGFNPIYGQGMTNAALSVELLEQCLTESPSMPSGFSLEFQRRLAKQCDPIWTLATGSDMQFETTEGDRPNALTRFVQRYVDLYLEIMPQDPVLVEQFFRVTNIEIAPSALLNPAMMWRVLRARTPKGHAELA